MTMLLVVLFVVANYVTFKVEPYLDEKFRAGIATISELFRKVLDGGCACIKNGMAPFLSWIRFKRHGTGRDGEREVLLGGGPAPG